MTRSSIPSSSLNESTKARASSERVVALSRQIYPCLPSLARVLASNPASPMLVARFAARLRASTITDGTRRALMQISDERRGRPVGVK